MRTRRRRRTNGRQRDAQLVATPAREDLERVSGAAVAQRPPQLRDVLLDHLRRARRRLLAPQPREQRVSRQDKPEPALELSGEEPPPPLVLELSGEEPPPPLVLERSGEQMQWIDEDGQPVEALPELELSGEEPPGPDEEDQADSAPPE